jgi:hypothetical protein
MYTYYQISSGSYKFYANVSQVDDATYIHLGGKKRCIIMIVYQESNDAILEMLEFHESCDKHANLQRGTGTMHMTISAFALLKMLFPTLEKVIFSDNSFVSCRNSTKLDLSTYYLALYGKTWYESKFNAFPEERYTKHYEKGKRKLAKILGKKPPFKSIMEDIDKLIIQELEPYYLNSTNLLDFIQRLKSSKVDCVLFCDWLFRIVTECIPYLTRFTWEIDWNAFDYSKIRVKTLPSKPFGMFSGGGKAFNKIKNDGL